MKQIIRIPLLIQQTEDF